jgi:hypothetical protein
VRELVPMVLSRTKARCFSSTTLAGQHLHDGASIVQCDQMRALAVQIQSDVVPGLPPVACCQSTWTLLTKILT